VLVTVSADGTSALLAGSGRLELIRASGETETLTAREAVTYVDRRLPADCVEILLTTEDTGAVPSRRSHLAGGVVGGSGAMVVLAEQTEPAEPAEPEPAEPATRPQALVAVPEPVPVPAPAFESISLFAADPATEAPASAPTGAVHDDVLPVVAEVLVHGIMCSRGHFNRPDSRFCARCGISMVQQTHSLVQGIRPPLGVIVLDDGAVHPLHTDFVLGRDPAGADDVRSGGAVALALDDPALTMSRVHARVLLDDWDVRVEDASSANGTFVEAPRTSGWVRLTPGVPTTILAGSRVSLGGRTLTFESHQKD
jgi:hypothetical protein